MSYREDVIQAIFRDVYLPMLRRRNLTPEELRRAEQIWVKTVIYGQKAPEAAIRAADAAIAPYVRPRGEKHSPSRKCDYCGRPDLDRQCQGCGAWRKDLR